MGKLDDGWVIKKNVLKPTASFICQHFIFSRSQDIRAETGLHKAAFD